VERATKPGGKNRPTPTRREREAANRRPLVPNDRKNAAKAAREQARQERLRTREALVTGDERHLPLRDRGPVKRFARDYVDARWNAGEFFLFVALIVVAFSFFATPEAQLITSALLWTTILACFADGWLLARKLRAAVVAKFGEDALAEKPVRYGVLRAFQIRRTRLPRPRVSRGQYPT
jgi:hypothetical protein